MGRYYPTTTSDCHESIWYGAAARQSQTSDTSLGHARQSNRTCPRSVEVCEQRPYFQIDLRIWILSTMCLNPPHGAHHSAQRSGTGIPLSPTSPASALMMHGKSEY
eukprot:1282758-Rhodomonas_salina.1